MRSTPPALALASLLAALPVAAQKPSGSLGNLPPPAQVAPPPQRPGPAPQVALPRDKPPPLGGTTRPPGFGQPGPGVGQPPQGFGQAPQAPPGQMAALPRSKPPPLGATGPGQAAAPGQGATPPGPRRQVSSGTGFVVAPRQIMTNQHVVDGCAAMTARLPNGQEIAATVIAADTQRDLALLRTDADAGPVLPFRRAAEMRRGEAVVTYGFPLAGLLSSGPTLTTGDVSALAGIEDNPRQIQISAPVQQGNSGGPLLDLRGHVVGVIVSKLNAQRIAQATGDIPQNVNFAVKHTEAVDFMREHGVQPLLEGTGTVRTAAEIGEVAHASTLFLRCLR
ncbi:S1C family serine protease [Roseomonas rosulenta]|uniref:S1C family serine protease n=1 Tax=Roseomonas rosulenta TaxID=2748667 RepID=UPI0018DF6FBB|nr:serine protease [Roseomonas rosulenta]